MQPSKMTDDQLSASVSLGAEAAFFLTSNPIYIGVILPAVKKMQADSADDGDWKPGKTTDPVAIAVYNSYNSGRKTELNFLADTLDRVVKDGLEAKKEITRREKV